MFKKASTVSFKGETRLKGKDVKKLKDALTSRCGEGASELFQPKADILVRKSGGGATIQFIFSDDECFFVQPDGRADCDKTELLPTLQALWKLGTSALLPCVLIHRPVARFVFRGANLMAPGACGVLRGPSGDGPATGDIVAVRAVGNPNACAVGRLLVPVSTLTAPGHKGEAVEVLLFFGDALWQATGSPRPAGFVGDTVEVTDPEEVARLGGGAASRDESESSADESEAEPAEAPADGPSTLETAQVDDADQITPADMDAALAECFLQAAKTRVKDKDLPMPGNTLYTQHMRPCRRAGSNIDVKASSSKKLAAFLGSLEARDWLALKKGSSDPIITKIFRNHPEYIDWKPWHRDATEEAVSGTSTDAVGNAAARITVESVWKAGKKLSGLLEAVPGSIEPEDGAWLPSDVSDLLKRYVDARDLWQKNNRKRFAPDGLLAPLLCEGSFSLESATDHVVASMQPCHRVSVPQGGAAGGVKRTIRSGKPPAVQVRTDTRRGHAVTLVCGLENYGVDMEALAGLLQKALASSATVEQDPQLAVMVQGFWEVAVVDWLAKAGIPTESIQTTAKKGQKQKKTSVASNIRKH